MKRLYAFIPLMVLLCVSISGQTEIPQLMSTLWHQQDPFNAQCPLVDGKRPASGCGAIAVGQMMYYYKQPTHGFGRAQYTPDNYTVDIDLTTCNFDYTKILEQYNSSSSSSAKEAVASLVSAVGASMWMRYGEHSAPRTFPSMMWGLQHFLHFSPQSRFRYRRYYTTAEWLEMLNRELENKRPVLYRGVHTVQNDRSGHLFVIDGKDKNGRYHANFGHAKSTQDKYVDMSIINQGTDTFPGNYNVCYHHQQAMVTDLYPVEGLTDADYDNVAVELNSPVILNGDPHAKTIRANGSVRLQFRIYYVRFTGGKGQLTWGFYKNGVLKGTSTTIRNISASNSGTNITFDREFTLPSGLPTGKYEMAVIYREDKDSPWVRGWDNTPNSIPAQLWSDGTWVFSMPNYHNLECNLYLENPIKEASNGKSGGKTFELTVCNPTDNNFEDTIRLEVTNGLKSAQYELPTSVYDG